ncbi:MAG: hypothetical protein KC613_21630, partial [Myxococcales bacterium]|nr:hypothetical protein [Myxococcales bacterium]
MHRFRITAAALSAPLALALTACVAEESASPTPEAADTSVSADGAAGGQDMQGQPDLAPDVGPPLDATVDAAVDPCALACDTFVACAAEVCEGLDAATAGALRPGCLDACAGNPAFATVVNGAG